VARHVHAPLGGAARTLFLSPPGSAAALLYTYRTRGIGPSARLLMQAFTLCADPHPSARSQLGLIYCSLLTNRATTHAIVLPPAAQPVPASLCNGGVRAALLLQLKGHDCPTVEFSTHTATLHCLVLRFFGFLHGAQHLPRTARLRATAAPATLSARACRGGSAPRMGAAAPCSTCIYLQYSTNARVAAAAHFNLRIACFVTYKGPFPALVT
jgi:hypothetical protein